jgi:beta-mannosidase
MPRCIDPVSNMTRPEHVRSLHTGWSVREADPALGIAANFTATEGWWPATVPGTIYQDLIASGRIPDPYLGRNEEQVQWVAERAWCYRLAFKMDTSERRAQMALVFEGLDTYAQAWLNGELIHSGDNMFVPARVDLAERLRDGRNDLWLHFDSALRRGHALEAHHGKRALWNGDSSRLYVRKAGYHYGWDWGPVLLTAGPWKPVLLQASDVHIAELHSPVWLADDLASARIDVHTTLAGAGAAGCVLRHVLRDARGQVVAQADVSALPSTAASLPVAAPELWWPAGHGAQPLYELVSELLTDAGGLVARHSRKLGLRRVRLVQQPVAGEPGRSFHFEINGREIFCGGANWIPDDNLLNRITPARYRERVAQAVAGRLLMLRVWGGGIYEDEAFYDACDELGVLVWQDFLFACGMYPAHPAFVASVDAEARAAVCRLRHRASLVIWCGNNEDYTLAETIGVYGPGKDLARFDARVIYEELLPTVCNELDPGRPYWPGSPYSSTTEGQLNSQDPTVGDRHSWEVWHQLMLPYAQYAKVGARFVSEFGMQSHPSLAVLDAAIPDADRFPGSRSLQWHNKAFSPVGADGHRRLAVYVADTLRAPATLAGEVYATQFVQAEAVRHAFEAFRRRWQQRGARGCGGALVWQLNDCWPVTSWALIDSGADRKPAWFSTRRALAPLACALRFEPAGLAAWAMNGTAQALTAHAQWQAWGLDGTLAEQHSTEVKLGADCSAELAVPAGLLAIDAASNVVSLSLVVSAELQASVSAWPEPFRWYRFPDPQIVAQPDGAGTLLLRAQRPAKGVWLAAPGAQFDDNFIDLMPQQDTRVRYQGTLDGLTLACLNTTQDAPVG